jgi:hypothetical protein
VLAVSLALLLFLRKQTLGRPSTLNVRIECYHPQTVDTCVLVGSQQRFAMRNKDQQTCDCRGKVRTRSRSTFACHFRSQDTLAHVPVTASDDNPHLGHSTMHMEHWPSAQRGMIAVLPVD